MISAEDQKLHEEFSLCGQNAREWTRKCALLLPEIERRFVWRKKGFGSLFEYAAKIGGMSRDSVMDALRIGHVVKRFPALARVAEEKGLQRVRPVLAEVTPETELFWAEKARSMSKMTLQTYVKDLRLERRSRTVGEPEKVEVKWKVNPALAKKLEALAKRVDFEELLEKFVDSVEVKSEAVALYSYRSETRSFRTNRRGVCLPYLSSACDFPSSHTAVCFGKSA